VDIGEDETAGDLTSRLAVMAAALLAASIGPYLAGELRPLPQVEEGASYAAKIKKAERQLSISDSPEQWTRKVRALAPQPAAFAIIDGEQVKILEATRATTAVSPGRWKEVEGWPVVGVAGGSVVIRRAQTAGRRPLSGDEWARGRQDRAGAVS
jgi:methionyl-tRNA formyltransferase